MHGSELAELIDLRWHTLRQLLAIGSQQLEAIQAAQMSGLMQLLSKKQSPLNELQQITHRLQAAKEDDPEQRLWDSSSQRGRLSLSAGRMRANVSRFARPREPSANRRCSRAEPRSGNGSIASMPVAKLQIGMPTMEEARAGAANLICRASDKELASLQDIALAV